MRFTTLRLRSWKAKPTCSEPWQKWWVLICFSRHEFPKPRMKFVIHGEENTSGQIYIAELPFIRFWCDGLILTKTILKHHRKWNPKCIFSLPWGDHTMFFSWNKFAWVRTLHSPTWTPPPYGKLPYTATTSNAAIVEVMTLRFHRVSMTGHCDDNSKRLDYHVGWLNNMNEWPKKPPSWNYQFPSPTIMEKACPLRFPTRPCQLVRIAYMWHPHWHRAEPRWHFKFWRANMMDAHSPCR